MPTRSQLCSKIRDIILKKTLKMLRKILQILIKCRSVWYPIVHIFTMHLHKSTATGREFDQKFIIQKCTLLWHSRSCYELLREMEKWNVRVGTQDVITFNWMKWAVVSWRQPTALFADYESRAFRCCNINAWKNGPIYITPTIFRMNHLQSIVITQGIL